jgi:hypothetical protein
MIKNRLIRNSLIAFAVALVVGLGIGFLNRLADPESPTISPIFPTVIAILVFFVLQMLSGNRKEVRVDDAGRQSSLHATAPAGQSLLYIYREGFVGKAVGWNVSLDGASLAQLRSPRFTQTTLSPGSHTLAASIGGFAATQNKPAETTFDAQPGEMIVFAMKSKMGAMSNTLIFVREADPSAVMQKLAKIPMVAPERPAGTAAA